MKETIKKMPVIGNVVTRLYWKLRAPVSKPAPFPGTHDYWEQPYRSGGNSGVGSYGKFADFKAEVVNGFVAKNSVQSVIEFGCGDGNQLKLADYPSYIGVDISEYVISACRDQFAGDTSKAFVVMDDYRGEKADLALSMDVIYHLVEDNVFERYMRTLFGAAERFVVIYSSNSDDNKGYEQSHIRHRNFTDWVNSNIPYWSLSKSIPNAHPYRGDYRVGSFADFFIYEMRGSR